MRFFSMGRVFNRSCFQKKPTMMAIRDAIIHLEYIQKKFFCPSDVHVGSILKGCRKKYHRYPWKAEGKNISTCLWLGSIQHVVYVYIYIYKYNIYIYILYTNVYLVGVFKASSEIWLKNRLYVKSPTSVYIIYIYIYCVCVLGCNPVTYPCTVCKTTGGRWPWDRQRWLGKTPSNVAKAIGIHHLQF